VPIPSFSPRLPKARSVPPLAERQRDFATAILNAGASPPGLLGPDGLPSDRRFVVYRNNVTVGLSEALTAAYPAVCRIVGDEFFRAMARVFIFAQPPASPILMEYGANFPDFIRNFEPAATLPYLADVARIERAWLEAYHAAEAAPLPAAALANIAPEKLTSLRIGLHPSLRLVRSSFPALSIYRINVDDGVPQPINLSRAEDCLIVRPAAQVSAHDVPPGGAAFVKGLAGGMPLQEAATAALAADQRFDLAGNLAGLISAGAIVSIDTDAVDGRC